MITRVFKMDISEWRPYWKSDCCNFQTGSMIKYFHLNTSYRFGGESITKYWNLNDSILHKKDLNDPFSSWTDDVSRHKVCWFLTGRAR